MSQIAPGQEISFLLLWMEAIKESEREEENNESVLNSPNFVILLVAIHVKAAGGSGRKLFPMVSLAQAPNQCRQRAFSGWLLK